MGAKLYEPYVAVSDPVTYAGAGATVQAIDVPAKTLPFYDARLGRLSRTETPLPQNAYLFS